MEEHVQENKVIRGVKARACLPPSIPYPVVKICIGQVQFKVGYGYIAITSNKIAFQMGLCYAIFANGPLQMETAASDKSG